MTYGAFRPRIVLPQDAPTWPESDLRRALTHELEHVRRGDWLVQLMARGVCALYWFHPLVWVAWRRLCLEGERACDDAVLQSADQTDYALQLVTLAERLSIDGPTPALSMANRSDLSVRVRAVLDRTQVRGRVGRATVAATLGMATAGVLLLAPLRVVAVERTAPDGGQVRTAAVAFVLPDRETHADPEVRVSRIEKRSRRVSRAIGELLVEAAGEGDIEAVVEMLDDGVDVNTVVEGDGTALIGAARGAQTRMVQLLLDRGAQPDLRSPGDGSPLIAAARDGSLDIVKILLDRGASIDLGAPGDGNPLIMAAGGGQLEMVRFLLDRGANIEALVPGDENPLIQACAAGQAEVVKYLVSRGANINTRVWVDHDGRNRSGGWRSPLTMARRHGHRALVDYLLSQGASDVRE